MNQTALITGGSKRIGRALVEHLALQGWNVVIHYNTSANEAKKLSEALKSTYPGQLFPVVKADLSDQVEVEKLIPEVLELVPSIELLVNNASVFDKGSIAETNPGLF